MINDADSVKQTEKEINDKISNLKKELFEIKFKKFTSGIQNPNIVKNLKKDIARLMTKKNMVKTEGKV